MKVTSIGSTFSRQVATCFSLGKIPFAPGTFGTIPAVALWYFLPPNMLIYSAIFVAIWIASLPGIRMVIDESGRDDPPEVVVDEMLGFLLAGVFFKRDVSTALSLFILFRVFDILKPWPASKADSESGPIFIVLDDLVAGFYAALVHGLVVVRLLHLTGGNN